MAVPTCDSCPADATRVTEQGAYGCDAHSQADDGGWVALALLAPERCGDHGLTYCVACYSDFLATQDRQSRARSEA